MLHSNGWLLLLLLLLLPATRYHILTISLCGLILEPAWFGLG